MAAKPKIYYSWRDGNYTVKEILAIAQSEDTALELTIPTLRARIKKTDGDVDTALTYVYVRKKTPTKVRKKVTCPDGIKRTHQDISKYLGVKYQTWCSRLRRMPLEEAWELGATQSKFATRAARNTDTKTKRHKSSEKQRQQKALDKLPSPTNYELKYL